MGKKKKMKKTAAAKVGAASAANVAAKSVAGASVSNANGDDAISKKSDLIENVENLKTSCEELQSLVSNSGNASSSTDSDVENKYKKVELAWMRSHSFVLLNERNSIPNVSSDLSWSIPNVSSDERESIPNVSRGERKSIPNVSSDERKSLPNVSSDERKSIPNVPSDESKARRLLMKLDLQSIPNVSRVAMRKSNNMLLYIDKPGVFQCPRSKTFIFFGEVQIDNASNAATSQAAERYINDGKSSHQSRYAIIVHNSDDEDIDVHALGGALDEKDIDLVEMQAGCSRMQAIKALVNHNSDVVDAIMELTTGAEQNV